MQKVIDVNEPLSSEQLAMLERAKNLPILYDEDCPEFSEEELKQFRRVSDERRSDRQKQTVTLRLSPQALRKARSLGKGYTSVLSRILESALENPDVVNHHL
ncbi:MAG: BrnA antitoxin family protein [Oscillospiraceae bacterium]|jgi:uncharacterized protein (DUF4415 family)|nr:BrnA antitoxin family protein [Oscillospiraceae bacterium]